eukprot:TRINITY_DN11360_c0_g1_i2.p1 TRINITY_DN11360_c0_g1~~TRINITY_DN11360_c0_g1_i2.p1  ORF type:complete len:344 (-),score=42.43 TRINITY_DN11360_c0_g1_i2:95-1018(-)
MSAGSARGGSAPRPGAEVLAAGFGAAATDTLFNPLAMITVRLQVDREKKLYKNLRQCGSRVLAEEGLLGLWTPGLVATCLRALTQTGLRIGLYPTVKRVFSGDGLLVKMAAGATTGAIGATVANPIELVRVKLQAEAGLLSCEGLYATGLRTGFAPSHAHTLAALSDIARTEGVFRGLWRGVPANVCRASLLSAGQLSTYDACKQAALRSGWADTPRLHLASSCLSGLVAQICCMPADVVKTRVQSGQYADRYRGSAHCFLSILRSEGVLALYRGFSAAAARQVPVMAVQMPIVEQVRKRLFGLDYL